MSTRYLASYPTSVAPAGVLLAGDAVASASGAGSLSTQIRLGASAVNAAASSGTLATALVLVGTVQAQAVGSASLAGSAATLVGGAVARASVAGVLATAIPLVGSAVAQATVAGTLTTGIALVGAATAVAAVIATLSNSEASPSSDIIDVSLIPLERVVVFEGSGSRIVVFEGSGSRIVIFDGSGNRVRFDQMSAKVPTKIGEKWTTDRDPDEISYYAADITQELLDRNTAPDSSKIAAVLFGVELLEGPELQVATVAGVDRTFVVVKLGGVDDPLPDDWRWVARVGCLNGERFDKTTWFNKVNP